MHNLRRRLRDFISDFASHHQPFRYFKCRWGCTRYFHGKSSTDFYDVKNWYLEKVAQAEDCLEIEGGTLELKDTMRLPIFRKVLVGPRCCTIKEAK